MMNYWHGIGNLCRDPESKTRSDGVLTCRFTLAVNRRKNKDGQSQADFIPIRCNRERAEVVMKYLKKGSKISVTGYLRTYSFQDQQGQNRFVMEVEAADIEFLPSGSKPQNGAGTGDAYDAPQTYNGATNDKGFTAVETDELPF